MFFDELNGLKQLVFLNSFHEQLRVLSLFCPGTRHALPRIKSGAGSCAGIHDLNPDA
jgi:hypothetical protein